MSLLLQNQEPIFLKLASTMRTFVKSLMAQFLAPTVLLETADLVDVPLEVKASLLPQSETGIFQK